MAELKETDLDPSPFAQFERWFGEARDTQPQFPEAMTIATSGADGVVCARAGVAPDSIASTAPAMNAAAGACRRGVRRRICMGRSQF